MRQTGVMIWKELTQVANRARFALQKLGLAAGLALLLLVMAYGEFAFQRHAGGLRWQMMAEFGRTFFWISAGLLTAALSGLAVVYASGMVAEESVHQRLPLLLVTPLGSAAIVSAKAASVFARAAAGVLVGVPIFAAVQFFGGVDRYNVLSALAFLSSNVWLYGCLGLFFSVLCRTTIGALLRSLVVLILWNSTPLYVALAAPGGAFTRPYCYAYAMSPVYVFEMLVENRLTAGLVGLHAAANLALGGCFLCCAVVLFRPAALQRISGEPQRRRGFFKRLAGGRQRKATRGRSRLSGVFGAGVVGKELASWRPRKILFSLGWFIVFYTMVLLALLVAGETDELGDEDMQFGLFAFEGLGFFFLFSVQAAARIAREKETRNLQGLILTRLSAVRIVLGKAAALVLEHIPAFTWLALHAAILAAVGFPTQYNTSVLVPGMVLTPVFCIALGFYFSISAKRVVSAVVLTGLTWILGAFGGLMGLFMLYELPGGRTPGLFLLWAICVGVLAAGVAGFALQRGRRAGYGAWLCAVSYVLLAAVVFQASAMYFAPPRETRVLESEEMVAASMSLPAPYVCAGLRGYNDKHAYSHIVVVMSVHAFLLVWMVLSALQSFEAQARRAY